MLTGPSGPQSNSSTDSGTKGPSLAPRGQVPCSLFSLHPYQQIAEDYQGYVVEVSLASRDHQKGGRGHLGHPLACLPTCLPNYRQDRPG